MSFAIAVVSITMAVPKMPNTGTVYALFTDHTVMKMSNWYALFLALLSSLSLPLWL